MVPLGSTLHPTSGVGGAGQRSPRVPPTRFSCTRCLGRPGFTALSRPLDGAAARPGTSGLPCGLPRLFPPLQRGLATPAPPGHREDSRGEGTPSAVQKEPGKGQLPLSLGQRNFKCPLWSRRHLVIQPPLTHLQGQGAPCLSSQPAARCPALTETGAFPNALLPVTCKV